MMPPASPSTSSAESKAAWDDRPMFALDADVTVYWPDVRPCYEEAPDGE